MLESKTSLINTKGNLKYITFKKLESTSLVRHAFTTRLGGVSEGFFSSMNMGFGRGEEDKKVRKNYEIICDAIGINTSNLCFSKQTHTSNVLCVTADDRGTGFTKPSFEDIDGLITNQPNVALVTQYADCTPLLFLDPQKKVIAASHSGWRGTVQQIGAVTVKKMQSEFGCCPQDIIAVIGPSICKDCYEVDTPVYNEFKKLPVDLSDVFTQKDNNHYMLDLKLANKKILLNAGLKEENIELCDICTACNETELYSHRKQGVNRGNLAAIIELK